MRTYFYEKDRSKEYSSTSRYRFAAPFVRHKKVLDIGCGARRGPWMISEVASEVVGVDISEEAIKHCRKNYNKDNVLYLVASATKLPFEEASFDTVLSFEVIEHIEDCSTYMAEARRVLKKGGIFVISTPNKPIVSPLGIPTNPDHIKEFEREEFTKTLKAFFSEVTMYGQFPSDRIKGIEDCKRENIRSAGKIPGFIKKMVPAGLKEALLETYHSATARLKKGIDGRAISEDDFTFGLKDVEKARYFVAVCVK